MSKGKGAGEGGSQGLEVCSQGAGWLAGRQWGRQKMGWEACCLCSKVAMAQPARVTCEGACGCRQTPQRGAGHAGREG